MFWQANKTAVIVLLLGLAAAFGAYFIIGSGPEGDLLLARQVLSTTICAALFAAALLSFVTAQNC